MRLERIPFSIVIALLLFAPTTVFAIVRDIVFPVAATSTFKDDFHDPRGGGTRQHLGIDIIAAKFSPVLAATDGEIVSIVSPEASWGYAITLLDDDGYQYRYLHLNNDTPGTDDGQGGEEHAYAPGIAIGARVHRGDLIGWVGDSGNAESVGAHLHFELREPGDHLAIDAYDTLTHASSSAPVTYVKGSTAKLVVPAAVSHVFTTKLAYGARGKEVKLLQQRLIELGYLKSGNATGYYGPATRKAVVALQKQHGLEQVGYVGVRTRAILNAA